MIAPSRLLIRFLSSLAALAALVAKDLEEGTKAQAKFFGKTIPKLHAVIYAMYETMGEREALEVVDATTPKQGKRVLRPRAAKASGSKKSKKVCLSVRFCKFCG